MVILFASVERVGVSRMQDFKFVIHEEGVLKNAVTTDVAKGGGVGQMLTLDDKVGRGVREMLTKGGGGRLDPLIFGGHNL